jgi:hypothetical protein
MARAKRKAEEKAVTTTETAGARPSTAYPLHEAYREYDPVKDNAAAIVTIDEVQKIRTCAGPMVLTEQAGREPKPLTLFCLSCLAEVPVDAAAWGRARDAARAEDWKPSAKGELTAGSAPEEVRRALFADHQLKVAPTFNKGEFDSWIKDGWPLVQAHGLASGHKLTAAGEKLQREIVAPDASLPDAVKGAPIDPAYLSAYTKRAKDPKARKPKPIVPSAPMVCTCSHGVASHTNRSEENLDSACREPGCACKRYVQPTPEKAPKAIKRPKKEARGAAA